MKILKQRSGLSQSWQIPMMLPSRLKFKAQSDNPITNGNRDYLSKLPLEIQHIIYDYLIGHARGKVSYLPLGYSGNLKTFRDEEKARQTAMDESVTPETKYSVRYHLPVSATPGVLLACRSMYKGAASRYHSICTTAIETTPEHFHELPSLDIIPDLEYHKVQEGFIHLGAAECEGPMYFSSIAFLQHAHKTTYPNLKGLVFVLDTPFKTLIGMEPCSTAHAKDFQYWWRRRVMPHHVHKHFPIHFETRGTVLRVCRTLATPTVPASVVEWKTIEAVSREQIVKDFFQGGLDLRFLCSGKKHWISEGKRWRTKNGYTSDTPYLCCA